MKFNAVILLILLSVAVCCLVPAVSASDPGSGDWPMWGGTPDRNMISNMKGLPTSWDVKTKKNVKWVAQLGSQTYGNVVVAGGMVFVGTNNEGLRDPKITGDKGIVMAFRESDGQFMWQMVHDKLAAGRVNDWPYQGVASSPYVDGSTCKSRPAIAVVAGKRVSRSPAANTSKAPAMSPPTTMARGLRTVTMAPSASPTRSTRPFHDSSSRGSARSAMRSRSRLARRPASS